MPPSTGVPIPDDGYRVLNVAEVLADLPSLDRDQLELVKALEECGDRRPVILDRIADLMVVREAADHVAAAVSPAPKHEPMAPAKELSPDLLAQMGGLLAKDAARKSAAKPPPLALAEPQPVDATASIVAHKAPPLTRARKAPKPAKAPDAAHAQGRLAAPAAPPAPGQIVPSDGRRSRRGRTGRRVLTTAVVLLILAGLAGGGYTYWKHTHQAGSPPNSPVAVILHHVPGTGYVLRSGVNGGSVSLAQAAHQDGAKDAVVALMQNGYLGGAQETWSASPGPQSVTVTVLQFRTVPGATAYGQRTVAAVMAQPHPPTKFPVPEITGAAGWSGGTPANQTAEIIFTKGAYVVKVVITNGTAPGAAHQATLVAVNQYTALLAAVAQ